MFDVNVLTIDDKTISMKNGTTQHLSLLICLVQLKRFLGLLKTLLMQMEALT